VELSLSSKEVNPRMGSSKKAVLADRLDRKVLTAATLVAAVATSSLSFREYHARADEGRAATDIGAIEETENPLPPPTAEEATHPGLLDEAEYTEAILAYNGRKYKEAIRILDTITRRSPGHLASLEMLALLRKAEGDEKGSLATYQKLLKAKPPAERGPYHFEVATLLFKKKNFDKARSFFTYALRLQFNEVACHFFLGLIDLGAKRFNSASMHFRAVIDSGNHEYRVAAHYYLGVAQFQLGAGTEGTAEILEARDRARSFPTSALAQQVSKASVEALKPQEGARWFGTVSALGQIDSNVQLTPDSVPDTQGSGKSSPKFTLSGSAGRMSSPLETWQWAPSLNAVLNRNLNDEAAEAQFITSSLMVFLNYRPLAANNGGIKLAASSTFQFLLDGVSDGSGSYAPFSYSGDLGPYLKFRLAPNWKLAVETAFRPQSFLTDETSGTAQRTGNSYFARTAIRTDSGLNSWLKPEFSISGEYLNTNGVDFRGTNFSFDLNNTLRILGRDALNLGANLQLVNYPDRADGARADTTIGLRASYVMPISTTVAFLADMSWSRNTSTVASLFSYTKFISGVGLNVSF
jgi:tetratricopeptide (TPR) repeat protein